MTRMDDDQNNNNKPNSPKARLVTEEAAIFNTFALIVRNKFLLTPSASPSASSSDSTTRQTQDTAQERINRLDELYSNPAYNAEKSMLQRMNNNGMVYGIACGLFAFGLLRSGPSLMQRYLNRSRLRGGGSSSGGGGNNAVGGYTFDRPTAGTGVDSSSSGSGSGSIRKGGFFLKTLKLGLDLALSLVISAYGSLLFVDRKKLMDDMSKIPLVEGRSLVSDELCDEFVNVYRIIPKQTWDKYQGKSDALDAIGGFVKNCIRREIVEKELLDKRRGFGIYQQVQDDHDGTDDNDDDGDGYGEKELKIRKRHVNIPSPGVSPDIPVSIEWIDNKGEDVIVGTRRIFGGGGDGGGDDNAGEDYFGSNGDEDDFDNFDDFMSEEDEDVNDGSSDYPLSSSSSSSNDYQNGRRGGRRNT